MVFKSASEWEGRWQSSIDNIMENAPLDMRHMPPLRVAYWLSRSFVGIALQAQWEMCLISHRPEKALLNVVEMLREIARVEWEWASLGRIDRPRSDLWREVCAWNDLADKIRHDSAPRMEQVFNAWVAKWLS